MTDRRKGGFGGGGVGGGGHNIPITFFKQEKCLTAF